MKLKKERRVFSRGFTMVELLAAITILGVISILAVTSVSAVLNNAKKNYYKTQEDNFEMAARSYLEKNKKYMPKVSGQYYDVKLNKLESSKYINKVVDYQKDKCYSDSYVRIFKYNDEYYYTTYLKCPNYTGKAEGQATDVSTSIVYKGQIQSSPRAIITITDSNSSSPELSPGIVSYQYKIYTGSDKKLVYTSDRFDGKEQTNISKTISLKQYVPAIITVEVNAINIYGKEIVKSEKTSDFADNSSNKNPTCKAISGDSTVWTTKNRTISVKCIDAPGGSGCARDVYTKEIRYSAKTVTFEVYDKAGNKGTCEVNAYVDKTAPSCSIVTGESTTWTRFNRTISVACRDRHSGCSSSSFSKVFNVSTKVGKITIKDNVGHTTTCNVNAYVDKEVPTCGKVTGASTTWKSGSRDISVACNDRGGSGCSSVSKSFTTTTKTSNITLRDNAGNSVSCPVDVYLDNNKPTCGSVTGASTSWTGNNRTITVACNDGDSGCSSTSKTFSDTTRTSSVTIRDRAGNTQSCPVNVYVDKTAPSCGSVYGASTSWTAGNRNISVNCSDSHSGCTQGNFSKYYNYTRRRDSITIRDNVGNTRDCGVNVYVDKTPPYTPVISFEAANDHTKIENDSCTWHYDNNWKSHSSISCSYTISFPYGKTFYMYNSPYYYDEDSGRGGLYAKYWCSDGSGGAYVPFWNWTEISSIDILVAANMATRCHTELRARDRVGNYSEVLYMDESLNRYR